MNTLKLHLEQNKKSGKVPTYDDSPMNSSIEEESGSMRSSAQNSARSNKKDESSNRKATRRVTVTSVEEGSKLKKQATPGATKKNSSVSKYAQRLQTRIESAKKGGVMSKVDQEQV